MFYLGLSLWTNLTAAVLKGRVIDMNRLPLEQVKIFISPEETRVALTDAGVKFSSPGRILPMRNILHLPSLTRMGIPISPDLSGNFLSGYKSACR